MKVLKHVLVLSFMLFTIYTFAQPKQILKKYAYSRLVTGGAQMVDENGKEVNNKQLQYSIFLETPKSFKLNVQNIWINELSYSIQVIPVKNLPVVIYTSNETKKTLVPKTTNKVWQLMVTLDDVQPRPNAALLKDMKANEVVISIEGCNNRILIKKIKELPNLMAE